MSNVAEAVSPAHPDKIADRIAGALVDMCYAKNKNPKCAFEVLIGHGRCMIVGETDTILDIDNVCMITRRISGIPDMEVFYREVPQDQELAKNQESEIKAGDNGIFFGSLMPKAHKSAKKLAKILYHKFPYDGKILLDGNKTTVCWSNVESCRLETMFAKGMKPNINPLGDWTGGVNVDTGVTGRKLACDFYGIGAPLGGGNMHGKDLSKADVSVNIVAFLLARKYKADIIASCSIGDSEVEFEWEDDGVVIVLQRTYGDVVKMAHQYIKKQGGFEKFAEWGLI